jgi:hypothetical protein
VISTLKQSIKTQRDLLTKELSQSLQHLAKELSPLLKEGQGQIDDRLSNSCKDLPFCKHIYVLDPKGVQISSTLSHDKIYHDAYGRDRSNRPYMKNMFTGDDLELSDSYISKNKKRPSLTAIQIIKNDKGDCIGFLGVDYDLRELPHTEDIYQEPGQWRQIKGDPSIRGGLFSQQRTESGLDASIDDALYLMEELMLGHGVHHCQIHFSSSRATIWHVDDPYVYRILTTDELLDPNICLAYPHRSYLKRAIVPALDIMHIFDQFKALRFMDETIYLRSGSLNLINGFIGLNFSCDGTHYLSYDEFQEKGMDFWLSGK